MDYNVIVKAETGNQSAKLASGPVTIEKDQREKGSSFWKKGQHITGTVISVDEQVTLSFDGHQVATARNIFDNVMPGDRKTFEVVRVSNQEVELRLLKDTAEPEKNALRAAKITESGWENILEQRKQSAKKTQKEEALKESKKQLDEIYSKLTEKDIQLLEQEGFPVEDFTVEGLCEALQRTKTKAYEKEKKIDGQAKAMDERGIADRLKQENLPVTTDHITKITTALELSNITEKIDDRTMRDLIFRGAQPTIENIYKAYYSATNQSPETGKLTDVEWNELEVQAKDIIEAAGFEVNSENLKDAKWILESKLPLTEETFTYKKALEKIKSGSNSEDVLNRIMEGMKQGVSPMDAELVTGDMVPYERILTNIHSIREDTIKEAVNEGKEITIRGLVTIQERMAKQGRAVETEQDTPVETSDKEASKEYDEETLLEGTEVADENARYYEEIKARRQLEEIRLKMTLEAASTLEKKGFSIETQRLEEVVEALRELEDSYYKSLLKEADAVDSDAALELLKETTYGVQQLRSIPSYVLGSTLQQRNVQTIPGLVSEGLKLQNSLMKAGEAYETLMTSPNSEYGDSIKKAFANMDSLLAELDIEDSEQNRRAVRILGYNRMEINEENLNQIKAYDLQVTSLMNNLHPAVTVRMIKEGINPLGMPIREVNTTIDRMKEEQGITSEEKFSTYLRKLEKDNRITEEERKAYIGIYRLLYNVDKSDGAALGAVIKAGQEVTLENLLTAVKTAKRGKLDAVINDEFGTLQSISRDKEAIEKQLVAFYQGDGEPSGKQEDEAYAKEQALVKEQTEYLERIIKQLKDEMDPGTLKEAGESMNATFGNLPGLSSESSLWDTIKDIPVEKLLEQLKNTETGMPQEDEAYSQKLQEIREICKNAEQSLRFLNDFKVPSTPLNIMLTNHILSNQESVIKKLMQLKDENKVENDEISLKESLELADTLIDKASMEEAYKKLESDSKEALNRACSEQRIDTQRLAELKSLRQQITFLSKLAEKEFYQIPIETEGSITNLNLTIVRGLGLGNVSVTLRSQQLGNIKADFTLKDKTLKGFISSDSRYGLERFEEHSDVIGDAARISDVTLKQIDYAFVSGQPEAYSYKSAEAKDQSTLVGKENERILYRLAKAIVQTVRLAEDSQQRHFGYKEVADV